MPHARSRRLLALLTAAAVLATMSAATLASPVAAAKPKCAGQTATIVGTGKADRIVGTAKRDIIVAKGGNDRIYGRGGNDLICAGGGNDLVYGGPGRDRVYGQVGRDRLLGNAGPDLLAGQVGNDILVGGTGIDTCLQGTGSGPVRTCERPLPPPPPPPAPTGPSLIPLTGILAVAYSDVDGLDGYSTGDVLIARLMDTSGNGIPSAGDTIEMGRYPTTLNPTSADFESWTAGPHTVVSVYDSDPNPEDYIVVQTAGGAAEHGWYWRGFGDEYYERTFATSDRSYVTEAGGVKRKLLMDPGSPSKPSRAIGELTDSDTGDWFVIDVELNKGP